MAAERSEDPGTEPDTDDAPWADQAQYKQNTQETRDVVVPEGEMKFRITQESPIRQAALIDEYEIRKMEDMVQELPQEADLQRNPAEVADSMNSEEGDAVLRLIAYFRDLLEPNVVKPDVHWADPAGEGFDLSTLDDADLIHLVDQVTGKDAGILPDEDVDPEERKKARAEKFRQ